MRGTGAILACAALCVGSAAAAEQAACPKFELGARYPWQSTQIMPGDRYTSISLDVDRSGFPIRCAFGKNNFPDPETLFWLCKSYTDRWRAPPAGPSGPKVRIFDRFVLISGYDHLVADRKARKRWFEQHPEQRPECYPEPVRPDRLG